MSDVVKVSDEDLAWLVSGARNLSGRATRFRERGPAIVVVTLGGSGAMAVTRWGVQCQVAAPRATVVDTVGAGDPFNAGLLAQLRSIGALDADRAANLGQSDLGSALRPAIAAASISVTRAGAQPPTRSGLDARRLVRSGEPDRQNARPDGPRR